MTLLTPLVVPQTAAVGGAGLLLDGDNLITVTAVVAPGFAVALGDEGGVDGDAVGEEDVAEEPAKAVGGAVVAEEEDALADEGFVAVSSLAEAADAALRGVDAEVADAVGAAVERH